jgi:hypothetical protein
MNNRIGCYNKLAPGDRIEYYSSNVYEVQNIFYEKDTFYVSAVGVHCGGIVIMANRLTLHSGELPYFKRIIKFKPKLSSTHPTAELPIAP